MPAQIQMSFQVSGQVLNKHINASDVLVLSHQGQWLSASSLGLALLEHGNGYAHYEGS